jgi:Tol biopolymer transport system component
MTFRFTSAASFLLLAVLLVVTRPGADAAFPGANGMIAFTQDAAGPESRIFAMNPDGSGRMALSAPGAMDDSPGWSADGNLIAFRRDSATPSEEGVYVMNADGSSAQQVPGTEDAYSPAFSPDGQRLALDLFMSGGDDDLGIINIDGTGLVNLTDTDDVDEYNAKWSPDGDRIVLVRSMPGVNGDIYTVNADGSGLSQLTNTPNDFEGNPGWSPDGTQIVFDFYVSEAERGIAVMNADGSGRQTLTDPGMIRYSPTFSPDGTMIAYVIVLSSVTVRAGLSAEIPGYAIAVMNADGSGETIISPLPDPQDYTPDWGVVPQEPTPTPVPGLRTWGDNNCSGAADPVDSLVTLRHDAGLGTDTGDCPEMGQVVEVALASPHPWGDVDCDGDVNPVDSLKLLRFDGGLDVAQEPNCPPIGSDVQISAPG